ncbi:MAG: hypothetical protein JST00_46175 [Deltaproteobacteria bacterium]|nr:hypothetical protein [Deltaproteobacteria bacterium]
MTNRLLFSGALSILLALVACSSGSGEVPSTSSSSSGSSSGGTGGLKAVVTSEAPAPPAGSKVALLWEVSAGSPDYIYAQSAGSLQASQVSLDAATPPAEALNGGKLGVAYVTVLDAAATTTDGKIDNDTFKSRALAISPDHAVIYRASTESAVKNGWDADFPQGYSCGKCVRAETGFDKFVPVSCSEVRLVPMSAKPKVCNWT